jgi:type I restriction-modification system DNA methylase subunit
MIEQQRVYRIKDLDSLLGFLREDLCWELPEASIDDVSFEWTGLDLNLNLSEDINKKLKGGLIRQLQPFATHQPWGIFVVEFATREVSIITLRQILRCFVAKRRGARPDLPAWQCENLLFICTTGSREFTFAHFCGDKLERAKISTFGWAPQEPVRTLCEFNLPALRYDYTWDSDTWLKGWKEAFDVEKVTREFFRQYARIFTDVEKRIKGFRDTAQKRLFTQRLFNRLMFIKFIQKKGWLKLDSQTNYLSALWRAYTQNGDSSTNFYLDRLKLLFFSGLNTPNDVNLVDINRGGFLKQLIGDVPYLNGGLFEEDDDDRDPEITVPDECFEAILTELFERFNFTVTESTPLDVEVAVDPEMLGKVFEELVTGRHETGSYYTPKPIVSFMCREGLKGYLQSKLPSESPEAIQKFVEEYDSAQLRNPEAVLEALRQIKVCDPACGSGAYLLGMLHELLDLRACLFVTKSLDPISAYQRKLEIIHNNLYGVDLDPFAVNIARLRLWLSLAVEFEGLHPPPLPNLDFKIETGDSLAAPDPSIGIQGTFRQKQIDNYIDLKTAYMTAHGSEKLTFRQEIEALRKEIATWTHGGKPVTGFDWPVEFAEVFANGGFDIVLANPPYVRQELISEIKPMLKEVYPDVYMGTADLYCYFYARALQLLRPGGMLAFISSNKWFRANYGKKLRKYIADRCDIASITDFGELPVFEASATFPMIFVSKRITDTLPEATKGPVFTQVKSLEAPYPDVGALIQQYGMELGKGSIDGENWALAGAQVEQILRKMEQDGIPLGNYVNGQIYRGILTGFNEAFIIDGNTRAELIERDKKSEEIIKRLLIGDDVRKWHIRERDRWLIVTPIGINIKHYPAVLAHLKQWQEELEARWDKGDHWWELRACDYYDIFDKPKITYPEIAKEPRFTLDYKRIYPIKTVFSIPVKDLFLLGLLNSTLAWFYLKNTCSVLGDAENRGRLTLQKIYIERIPVPKASAQDKAKISELAKKCLSSKGENCQEWEKEIDKIVARLYGLEGESSLLSDG